MGNNDNFVKDITNIEEDFAKWYTDIVLKAELADYTDTKGCIAIRQYGYAIWENIQKYADEKFKENGVKNISMPLLIPEKLLQKDIPFTKRKATRITIEDYKYYDFIIGMDSANIRDLTRIFGGDPEKKIYKMLDFTDREGDVADPWYTGNFDDTYDDIVEGCEGFLEYLQTQGLK